MGIFQFPQVGEAGQVFGGLGLCLRRKAGGDPRFCNDDGIDGGVGWALPLPVFCFNSLSKCPPYKSSDRTDKLPKIPLFVVCGLLIFHRIQSRCNSPIYTYPLSIVEDPIESLRVLQ